MHTASANQRDCLVEETIRTVCKELYGRGRWWGETRRDVGSGFKWKCNGQEEKVVAVTVNRDRRQVPTTAVWRSCSILNDSFLKSSPRFNLWQIRVIRAYL